MTRANDDEISALSRIVDLLAPLEPEARNRVLDYVSDRFESREAGPALRGDYVAIDGLPDNAIAAADDAKDPAPRVTAERRSK